MRLIRDEESGAAGGGARQLASRRDVDETDSVRNSPCDVSLCDDICDHVVVCACVTAKQFDGGDVTEQQ